MILHQQSIAELERRAFTTMKKARCYRPTDEDRKRGALALVLEKVDEDGDPDWNSTKHIIPTYGEIHYLSDLCWCEPQIEADGFRIHRASQ